jgi:catechol 2,3-dioxygenase-like lactoylglutathione lyase family enzyme
MRIEHIGIYAHDTEALSKWYENVLKMRVVRKLEKEGRPPIFFLKGESETELEILPASQKEFTRELSDPGYSHLGIVVENFEEVVQYLQDRGVKVEGVRTTTNGWTIGYFTDPEGNRLEIVYRPKGG